jgi:hypothetical protein
MVTRRFRGAVRGQSGHLVIGTGPYCGQRDWEDEALDICRRDLSPEPEKKRGQGWKMRATVEMVALDGSGEWRLCFLLLVVGPTP